MVDYQLIIIGTGMAGIPAMRKAYQLGVKTATVIGEKFGGTCLNDGCIPTKALARVAHLKEQIENSSKYGLSTKTSFDFKKVYDYKNNVIKTLGGLRKESVADWGIELIEGKAKFVGPNEIEVEGKKLSADKFLIATGARPAIPPITGAELAIDSTAMLQIDELPENLVIIGSGFIGVEFGSILNIFGSKVTILEIADRPLAKFPKDISGFVSESFERRGIEFIGNASVKSIEKSNGQFRVSFEVDGKKKRLEADLVGFGTGRIPNVNNLDLEKAAINYSDKGIKVNEFLQSSNPNIYAAGDVLGVVQLTSVSNYTGELAIHNAFSDDKKSVNYQVIPFAVFSEPPVAVVGEDAGELKVKGINAGFMKVPYSRLPRANANGATEGFIKIVFNKDNDKVLGAQVAGENADDLIHNFALAIKGNMTRQDLAELKFFHPSLSEGIRFAARQEIIGHQNEDECCG